MDSDMDSSLMLSQFDKNPKKKRRNVKIIDKIKPQMPKRNRGGATKAKEGNQRNTRGNRQIRN